MEVLEFARRNTTYYVWDDFIFKKMTDRRKNAQIPAPPKYICCWPKCRVTATSADGNVVVSAAHLHEQPSNQLSALRVKNILRQLASQSDMVPNKLHRDAVAQVPGGAQYSEKTADSFIRKVRRVEVPAEPLSLENAHAMLTNPDLFYLRRHITDQGNVPHDFYAGIAAVDGLETCAFLMKSRQRAHYVGKVFVFLFQASTGHEYLGVHTVQENENTAPVIRPIGHSLLEELHEGTLHAALLRLLPLQKLVADTTFLVYPNEHLLRALKRIFPQGHYTCPSILFAVAVLRMFILRNPAVDLVDAFRGSPDHRSAMGRVLALTCLRPEELQGGLNSLAHLPPSFQQLLQDLQNLSTSLTPTVLSVYHTFNIHVEASLQEMIMRSASFLLLRQMSFWKLYMKIRNLDKNSGKHDVISAATVQVMRDLKTAMLAASEVADRLPDVARYMSGRLRMLSTLNRLPAPVMHQAPEAVQEPQADDMAEPVPPEPQVNVGGQPLHVPEAPAADQEGINAEGQAGAMAEPVPPEPQVNVGGQPLHVPEAPEADQEGIDSEAQAGVMAEPVPPEPQVNVGGQPLDVPLAPEADQQGMMHAAVVAEDTSQVMQPQYQLYEEEPQFNFQKTRAAAHQGLIVEAQVNDVSHVLQQEPQIYGEEGQLDLQEDLVSQQVDDPIEMLLRAEMTAPIVDEDFYNAFTSEFLNEVHSARTGGMAPEHVQILRENVLHHRDTIGHSLFSDQKKTYCKTHLRKRKRDN